METTSNHLIPPADRGLLVSLQIRKMSYHHQMGVSQVAEDAEVFSPVPFLLVLFSALYPSLLSPLLLSPYALSRDVPAPVSPCVLAPVSLFAPAPAAVVPSPPLAFVPFPGVPVPHVPWLWLSLAPVASVVLGATSVHALSFLVQVPTFFHDLVIPAPFQPAVVKVW